MILKLFPGNRLQNQGAHYTWVCIIHGYYGNWGDACTATGKGLTFEELHAKMSIVTILDHP